MRSLALGILLLLLSSCGYEMHYSPVALQRRAELQNISVMTAQGTRITLDEFGDNDVIFEVVSLPRHGTLSGAAPDLFYAPDDNFEGVDEFIFRTVSVSTQASSLRKLRLIVAL